MCAFQTGFQPFARRSARKSWRSSSVIGQPGLEHQPLSAGTSQPRLAHPREPCRDLPWRSTSRTRVSIVVDHRHTPSMHARRTSCTRPPAVQRVAGPRHQRVRPCAPHGRSSLAAWETRRHDVGIGGSPWRRFFRCFWACFALPLPSGGFATPPCSPFPSGARRPWPGSLPGRSSLALASSSWSTGYATVRNRWAVTSPRPQRTRAWPLVPQIGSGRRVPCPRQIRARREGGALGTLEVSVERPGHGHEVAP